MSNFVLEIFDDEGTECSFYTVRYLDAEISETERFFDKFYRDASLKSYVQELAVLLQNEIGNKYGAREIFFRPERKAQALPPKPGLREIRIPYNFPLRLYCLRLSNSCVILFNGGEKTSQTSQGGKTSMAFHEANEFADRILEALRGRILKLDHNQKSIMDYYESDDISEIIL